MHDPSRLLQQWRLNKYLWMSLGFAVAYLAAAQAMGRVSLPPTAAWTLLVLAIANGAARSILGYVFHEKGPLRSTLYFASWAFTVADIALVGAAVHFTGGPTSELWLLYFVVVLSESLYAPPAQVRVVSILVGLSYLLAVWPPLEASAERTSFWTIAVSRIFILSIVGAYARRISYSAEEKGKETLLLREQVAAGEERVRIAREIHDGLGHAMTGTILRLELCRKLIKVDPEETQAILDAEVPALREAWSKGRDMAFHLRPWELDETGGFEEVLRRHASRFTERTGLIIEVSVTGEIDALAPSVRFALLRIAQEALTNVAKHAEASRVAIRMRREANDCLLEIEDDGRGFDVSAASSGVGMASLRERAQFLRGDLEIDSVLGRGTRICVSFRA